MALTLAACAPAPEQAEAPREAAVESAAAETVPNQISDEDACGKAAFAHLIGAPAREIDQTALPDGTRIITPETMVTQDYASTRLNILTGADGRVSSLGCY